MNIPTIIVTGVIASAVIAIIVKGIKNRKDGKCSCGCSGCSMNCHGKK